MKSGLKSKIKKSFALLSASTMMLTLQGCGNTMEGSYKMTSYKVDRNETYTKDIKKIYEKHDIYYGTLKVDKNNKATVRLTGEDEEREFKYEDDVFIDDSSNKMNCDFDEETGSIKLKGKIDGRRIEMTFEKLSESEAADLEKRDPDDDYEEIKDALSDTVLRNIMGDWTLRYIDGESLEYVAGALGEKECFWKTNFTVTDSQIKTTGLNSDGSYRTKTYSLKVKSNGIEGYDGDTLVLCMIYDKDAGSLNVSYENDIRRFQLYKGLADLDGSYREAMNDQRNGEPYDEGYDDYEYDDYYDDYEYEDYDDYEYGDYDDYNNYEYINDEYDLGGIEIYIRDWWSPGNVDEPDEYREPYSEYEQAKYAYQDEVMKKYNFKMYEVGGDDWGMTSTDFFNYVTTGGDAKNYIWTLHSNPECYNAMKLGLMADLSRMDCLDFSEDKFKRNRVHEKYSIGSSIYAFFPGYSEPRTGVYFNKKILREAGIDPDYIYEAQKNGTWTWDVFESIMSRCQRDTNGDGMDDIFGLTLNESVMTDAAVFSNGGSYFKKEDGRLVYNVESTETMEALQWCIDMYTKYDNHDPEYSSWDYYQQEWRDGKAVFLVEQEYANIPGNIFSDIYDFEIGFVMFPKGPKATRTVNVWDNNIYVIPACYVGKDIDAYGHDRAWRIAFAWNMYTNPVPGYEDANGYLERAKSGNFDTRALSETIPMMCDSEHGVIEYHDYIAGIDLGPELTWNIGAYGNLAQTVEALRDRWKKAADSANQ